MNADLSKLTDKTLAYVLEQLERVAALKFSTTAIGVRLLAQYQERLDAPLEVERRKT
jgi:ribosome maturation protein Sdo1